MTQSPTERNVQSKERERLNQLSSVAGIKKKKKRVINSNRKIISGITHRK